MNGKNTERFQLTPLFAELFWIVILQRQSNTKQTFGNTGPLYLWNIYRFVKYCKVDWKTFYLTENDILLSLTRGEGYPY